MKAQDESGNRFRCMVCNEWRLRGLMVPVEKGALRGYEIKTCQSQACAEKARTSLLGTMKGECAPQTINADEIILSKSDLISALDKAECPLSSSLKIVEKLFKGV